MKQSAELIIRELANQAGITINGPNAWDMQVIDPRFYQKAVTGTSLAMGESYMAGWWKADRLDEFFERVFRAGLEHKVKVSWAARRLFMKSGLFNRQSAARAFIVGRRHYDIDNELYRLMLDSSMSYSCAYWKNAHTLEQAQHDKLDLICRKLGLKPGMTLLDIGCGWGGLVKFACKHYGVSATGITISKQQYKLAQERCAGLPVELRLQDYRLLNDEQFDAIASIGMVEHVGQKNFRSFMKVARNCLKPGGLFLLHSIGSNQSDTHVDPWIDKYIFPNSVLPSMNQLTKACENVLTIEDLHSVGEYYDTTLMAWHENFVANWDKIKHRYDDQFYRMWRYYLLVCAASFRTRRILVWQFLLTHPERRGTIETVR